MSGYTPKPIGFIVQKDGAMEDKPWTVKLASGYELGSYATAFIALGYASSWILEKRREVEVRVVFENGNSGAYFLDDNGWLQKSPCPGVGS